MEAFAREISECGDAVIGDFGGTGLLGSSSKILEFIELLHQRTEVAHQAARGSGSGFRGPIQRIGPEGSADKV